MKTNLDGLFKMDETSEKEGVMFWINSKTGFRVLPFNPESPRVKSALAQYYKPYARQIEMGTLDDLKNREMSIKLFVYACLVDWVGVEIDGKDTPYSTEVAIQFFQELPQLYRTLWQHCSEFKNFRQDVGNS